VFFLEEISMKSVFSKILALISCLAIAATMFAAAVRADDDMEQMRVIAKNNSLITPDQAIDKALAAKPGTVKETDLERSAGGSYYEVEILDAQGLEWEVKVNAQTGEVGKVKRD
jgi:uncharacterized membrane protein YkoI